MTLRWHVAIMFRCEDDAEDGTINKNDNFLTFSSLGVA